MIMSRCSSQKYTMKRCHLFCLPVFIWKRKRYRHLFCVSYESCCRSRCHFCSQKTPHIIQLMHLLVSNHWYRQELSYSVQLGHQMVMTAALWRLRLCSCSQGLCRAGRAFLIHLCNLRLKKICRKMWNYTFCYFWIYKDTVMSRSLWCL